MMVIAWLVVAFNVAVTVYIGIEYVKEKSGLLRLRSRRRRG